MHSTGSNLYVYSSKSDSVFVEKFDGSSWTDVTYDFPVAGPPSVQASAFDGSRLLFLLLLNSGDRVIYALDEGLGSWVVYDPSLPVNIDRGFLRNDDYFLYTSNNSGTRKVLTAEFGGAFQDFPVPPDNGQVSATFRDLETIPV